MKPDYSEIRTVEELERAIARTSDAIRHKENVLNRRYRRLQHFYSPASLASEGMRRVVSFLPIPEFAFRFFARLFRRK